VETANLISQATVCLPVRLAEMSTTVICTPGNPKTEIQAADIIFGDEFRILLVEISLPSPSSQNDVAIVQSINMYEVTAKSTRNT